MKMNRNEMEALYAFGCPNLKATVERLRMVAALAPDPVAKKLFYMLSVKLRCFGINMPKSRDIQAKIHSKCASHFFHLTKLGCYVNIHKCVTKRNKNVIILQRCITGVDQ